jgi:hypothetical protein
MSKPIDLQYSYKKVLGFTKQQKRTFETLEKYNVNVNQFIRAAIREKIQRDWPKIKESTNNKCPFEQ